MNTDLMFSSADETWTTPRDRWEEWNAEFHFTLDAAALSTSTLCDEWFGPDHSDETRRDALLCAWTTTGAVWLNPPYGRSIAPFMAKADAESRNGATIVCLVPARTDTRWWHDHVIHHEVRFIRGRLRFGKATNGAPFPSALIVMRPAAARGDEPIAVGIVDKGITGPSIDAQSCICQPTNICSRTCGLFACEHVGCTIQGEHEHNGGAARGDGE